MFLYFNYKARKAKCNPPGNKIAAEWGKFGIIYSKLGIKSAELDSSHINASAMGCLASKIRAAYLIIPPLLSTSHMRRPTIPHLAIATSIFRPCPKPISAPPIPARRLHSKPKSLSEPRIDHSDSQTKSQAPNQKAPLSQSTPEPIQRRETEALNV